MWFIRILVNQVSKSSKPIVCISGSRSINWINLDLFIDPNHVGQIIQGGAIGIDTLAKQWAKRNKIDCITFLPNWKIFGKKAGLERNRAMIEYCDILIAFHDGKSTGTLYTINYAKSIGVPCICHLIKEFD